MGEIKRQLELQERPIAHLWVGRSKENADAAELLFDVNFPFVAIPAEGLAKPELLVGPYRYRGIESIRKVAEQWEKEK